MTRYDILYYCEHCRSTHPMGLALEVAGGPGRRTSLRAYIAAENLPKAVSEVIGSPVTCPQTGRKIVTEDLSRIYIQPLPQTSPA